MLFETSVNSSNILNFMYSIPESPSLLMKIKISSSTFYLRKRVHFLTGIAILSLPSLGTVTFKRSKNVYAGSTVQTGTIETLVNIYRSQQGIINMACVSIRDYNYIVGIISLFFSIKS